MTSNGVKEFLRNIVVSLLTLEAKVVLKKYRPQVMVITGSVGKTSSKNAAYAALKKHTFVRKSEKSFNADIGVPLTILGVPNGWTNIIQWLRNLIDGLVLMILVTPYPRWLILEIGADRPGDISQSLSWLKPNVVVATTFPKVPVHVEFYESPEAVIEEELFPLSHLPQDGVAVFNIDDTQSQNAKARVPDGVRTITYGFSKSADVRALNVRVLTAQGMPRGISFDVAHEGEKLHVTIENVVGKTHVYAVVAGVSGALAVGANLSDMAAVGDEYRAAPGRLNIVPGARSTILIDDTYNASPIATNEALETLKGLPTKGKRVAVLGDMLELGKYSLKEHEEVGEKAAQCTDFLVTVGVRARGAAETALGAGMSEGQVKSFEKNTDAISFLKSILKESDVVLIKGSQSMRMERIVKALMATPEKAEKLLPRQDPEWLARS